MSLVKFLQPSEKVKHVQWQHPWVLWQGLCLQWRWIAFLFGYVLVISLINNVFSDESRSVVFALVNVSFLVFTFSRFGRVVWLKPYLGIMNILGFFFTRHIITNQRVLQVNGIFKKGVTSYPIVEIEDMYTRVKSKLFNVRVLYFVMKDFEKSSGLPYMKQPEIFMHKVMKLHSGIKFLSEDR